jgi:hypothetical protein
LLSDFLRGKLEAVPDFPFPFDEGGGAYFSRELAVKFLFSKFPKVFVQFFREIEHLGDDVLLDGCLLESFPAIFFEPIDVIPGQKESGRVFFPKAKKFDPKSSPVDFVHFGEVDPGDVNRKDPSVPGRIVEDVFVVCGSAKDGEPSEVFRYSVVRFADRDDLFGEDLFEKFGLLLRFSSEFVVANDQFFRHEEIRILSRVEFVFTIVTTEINGKEFPKESGLSDILFSAKDQTKDGVGSHHGADDSKKPFLDHDSPEFDVSFPVVFDADGGKEFVQ